ncbi:MAG TPA: sulfatase-like hydrolase/transferase [Polyangiaceae bacterium]|nr:sulfatase-like hydrolase/transferase [Polyangiaceae bacterium]
MSRLSMWGRPKSKRATRDDFVVRRIDRRPDIVLFLTDEQRHDEVGFASGGFYETPELDRLAARGVAFETAYSGSTVCVPSRGCLLTGLLHHRLPTQGNGLALREGFWTVARALKAVGYETALIGKMHFSPMYADHGFDTMKLAEHLVPFSGYDPGEIDDYHRFLMWQGLADHSATHFFGPGLERESDAFDASYFAVPFPYDKSFHAIGWTAQTAREVIRARKNGAPLFLVVSFTRPHAPYDPAEPYASMYDPKDARIPADGIDANAALPERVRQALLPDAAQMFNAFPASSLDEGVYRRVLTYVRALVRQIDDAMGEVLRELDPARTVTFFTSDHGTYGGHRGLLGKVPWIPFDDLARVPFVCAAPGAMAGRRERAPIQSFDFALTCLDYAGIEPPENTFDAVSLRPFVQGYPAPPDRTVLSAASVGWPMARRGALKLIRIPDKGRLAFDLDRDPGETKNVADDADYRERVAALGAMLDASEKRPMPAALDKA